MTFFKKIIIILFLINKYLLFGNKKIESYFFVKLCNNETESAIRPILYYFRPIRLLNFCTLAIIASIEKPF